MAVVILGNDTNGAIANGLGDLHILPEGRYLAHTGNAFSFSSNSGTLDVHGSISAEFDGVVSNLAQLVNINIGASGSVSGDSDGIELSGDQSTVVNNGTIVGFGDNGFEVFAASRSFLTNNGSIFGANNGVVFDVTGSNYSLVNHGSISGGDAVVVRASATITNTGQISGQATSVQTIAYGIRIQGFTGGTVDLINSGIISGDTASYNSRLNIIDNIQNSGGFLGNIGLNDQNDSYVAGSTGYILGFLDAGSGNDTIIGGDAGDDFRGADGDDRLNGGGGDDTLDGGAGLDTIIGGAGDDELTGGSGADELSGRLGDDTILGGSGNDSVLGGAGHDSISGAAGNDDIGGQTGNDTIRGGNSADTLRGGAGDDDLRGDAGNDLIRGGTGNDALKGDKGADTLRGGGGDDTLTGSSDADTIWGGAGADVFEYLRISDSAPSARDTIRDFQQGLDRIDLSEVAEFTFRGGSGFSGGGTASVRFTTTQNRTDIRLDSDGNGSQDAVIQLTGVFDVTASDFIL